MSRIGKQPVVIPAGVSVAVTDGRILVKGPKGELSEQMYPGIAVAIEDGKVLVTRKANDPQVLCHLQLRDRKSTRLNSSHQIISYAVFCLKKKIAPLYAFYTVIYAPSICLLSTA